MDDQDEDDNAARVIRIEPIPPQLPPSPTAEGLPEFRFDTLRARIRPLATSNLSERPIPLSGHKSFRVGRHFYIHHICGLFSFDLVSFRWTRLTEFSASSTLPPSRRNHSFHYVPHLSSFLLYGGIHQSDVSQSSVRPTDRILSDVHLYHLPSSTWHDVTPESGPKPIGRCSHNSVFRVRDCCLYVFGGIFERSEGRVGADMGLWKLSLESLSLDDEEQEEEGEGEEGGLHVSVLEKARNLLRWERINVFEPAGLVADNDPSMHIRSVARQNLFFCTPIMPLGNGCVLSSDESDLFIILGVTAGNMNLLTYAYNFERNHFRVFQTHSLWQRIAAPTETTPLPPVITVSSELPEAIQEPVRHGALSLAIAPPHPPSRVYFGCHLHSTNRVLIYGGERYEHRRSGSSSSSPQTVLGDMFELNLRTGQWTEILEEEGEGGEEGEGREDQRRLFTQSLLPRTNCAIVRFRRRIYLFGGGLGPKRRTNEMLVVDLRDYTIFDDGAEGSDDADDGDENESRVPKEYVDLEIVCLV